MASESPEVVVAPVMENGGAESSSSSKGKEEEQLESELSKKLEITEDAVEENEEDAEEDGSKGETSTKKKKKKRVKASKTLFCFVFFFQFTWFGVCFSDGFGYVCRKKPQQTDPPTIPVVKLFPSGEFPEGEIQQYKDDLWRTTSEEKRELERLEKPIYNSVRQAAEVHRQVENILVTAHPLSMCNYSDSGKLILGPSPDWFTGAARTSGFQTHF
ncbi:Methionine aminopeptidase 2B [Raphanus sativus]|nr:Methionine aminopeptidase 2B [Raphanus sativus]